MRRRAQRGQVMLLVALLSTVLAGFVGLVIDGGQVAARQQLVRNASDGAALAAGYALFKQGSTLSAASAAASDVLLEDGLPAADLSVTYLDSSGAVTTTASAVKTIRATVTDSQPTHFMQLLGVASAQVSAVAQVGATAGGAPCALCAMVGSATGLSLGGFSVTTVTGASVMVNSTANPGVSVGSGASLTSPANVFTGSNVQNSGTISPNPVTGGPLADPLASVPSPSLSGSATSYFAPSGSASISPGIYSRIIQSAGGTLTLNPGVYVLTGPLSVSSGTITGSGVTIYLACSAYPTPCGSGAGGAAVSASGGTLTLGPPSSGTYAGLTVFGDRNNVTASTFSRNSVTVTGTWYTLSAAIQNTHSGDTLRFGQLVVRSFTLASASRLTVAYVASQSYGGSGGSLGLSL